MDTAEKERVAKMLDTRVRTLRFAGLDDAALFAVMGEQMPALKRFMDAGGLAPGELDQQIGRAHV